MLANVPTRDGRIWSFSSSYEAYLVVLFTDQKIALYDPNGAVIGNNLTTDPTFTDGAANWNTRLTGGNSQVLFAESNTRLIPQESNLETVQNGDFTQADLYWAETTDIQATVTYGNNTVTLTGGNAAARFAAIAQTITILNPGVQHDVSGVFVTGQCKLRIGTAPGLGDVLEDLNYTGGSLSFTPASNVYLTLESYGDGDVVTIDVISIIDTTQGSSGIAQQVTTPDSGSPHVVRVSTRGGVQYRIRVGTAEGDGAYLDVVTSSDIASYNFTPIGDYWVTVDATQGEVTVTAIYSYAASPTAELNFNTPYPNDVLNDLYFVTVPDPTPETDSGGDTNTLYVLHPNYPPHKLTRQSDTGIYNFTQVSFTSPPQNWTGTNWPSCGTYFQGRLWLAATPNRGQRFWASRSNQPENFDQGTALADESLEFTLNELGRIEWMAATKNLIIGTTYGEHLVGSQDGPITPDDIQVEQQSSYGSRSVQPLQIGDEILFVSPDGLKLRATQYDFTKDNWIARDVTFFSEHITESGIRNIAWAQHPDQLLWCALENGDAAVLSYERGEGVYGWSKHTTGGFYRDFTAAQLGGTSYVLALTQRENQSLYLEIQDEDIYMDSYIETTAQSPTTNFPGFDHLIGLAVQVILDGAIHPDVVVAEDGSITTEWEGTRCEAGIGYTSLLETLPMAQPTQTGSAQPYQKRYDQLLVTLLDSALPIINGERRADRTPSTPMDTREPDVEGVLRTEQVILGWSQDATVIIEQPLPLACTVMSIAGRLAMEKL